MKLIDCTNSSEAPAAGEALSPETARALDIARDLTRAGVPVFVAPPNSQRPGEFLLPKGWQTWRANPNVIDQWRPGWALAAVCGHAFDVLDVDPRNGGDASARGVKAAGMWPRSYGQASTPSGGTHDLITPLRIGRGKPAAGIDLQGGKPDGSSRAFVYIAPTVRISKATGQPTPYLWIVEPDLVLLAEEGPDDDSGVAIAEMATSGKGKPSSPASDRLNGLSLTQPGDIRTFTREQAVEFCRPAVEALSSATNGTINTRLNDAAKALSHFGEEFWSRAQVENWLTEALTKTEYDGRTWKAADTIESAYRSASGDWRASFVPSLNGSAASPGEAPFDPAAERERLITREIERIEIREEAKRRREAGMVDAQQDEGERAGWQPVDLAEVLNGTAEIVKPEIGRRNDGAPLLYRGKEHSIASEPECGKTWWALMQVMDVLQRDGRVLYVDFEDDARTIVGRLLTMGIHKARLTAEGNQFRYVRPEGAHQLAWLSALLDFGNDAYADLVIYDGVTEGMALFDLDPLKQDSAAKWRQLLIKPALNVGAATLSTDHVVKRKEDRGGYAIGAQHKLAGLNGAQFLMEKVKPFGRGLKGRSRVLVSKDRNGGLRQFGQQTCEPGVTYLGDLVGDATSGEMTSLIFWPPREEDTTPEEEGAVPRHLRKYVPGVIDALRAAGEPLTTNGITDRCTGTATEVRRALAWLVDNGHVEARKVGQRMDHTLLSDPLAAEQPPE